MRSIQFLGLLTSIVSFLCLFWALAPLSPDSSASVEGAIGLFLMFGVAPLFGFSALLLIPSSIALSNAKLRANTYFYGKFWYGVWGINSLISIGYVFVILYIGYIYLTLKVSN